MMLETQPVIFMKKKEKSSNGDGDPPGGVADEVDEDDGDE